LRGTFQSTVEGTVDDALRRRRALDRAARALPDPSVVSAVASHLGGRCDGTHVVSPLAPRLSETLSLPGPLTFRSNTTQAIRDFVQLSLLHLLDPSHGRAATPGRLLGVDAQHPAVREALRTTWSDMVEVPLAALALDPGCRLGEAARRRYRAIASEGAVSVAVIPHVLWFNGAILDVAGICRALRSVAPDVVTIVDGAQAVGQVAPPELSDVDFYVGCGHKWLGGPETLGFASVSQRALGRCRRCAEALAAGDVLGEVGGLVERYQGSQHGTHQLGVAHGMLQALTLLDERPGGLPAVRELAKTLADRLRGGVADIAGLTLLGPAREASSSVVAFTTSDERLRAIQAALDAEGFSPASYPLAAVTGGSGRFLRLSPGPDLTGDELERVLHILQTTLPSTRHP